MAFITNFGEKRNWCIHHLFNILYGSLVFSNLANFSILCRIWNYPIEFEHIWKILNSIFKSELSFFYLFFVMTVLRFRYISHILFKSNFFSILYIVESHRYLMISIILLFHDKERRVTQELLNWILRAWQAFGAIEFSYICIFEKQTLINIAQKLLLKSYKFMLH